MSVRERLIRWAVPVQVYGGVLLVGVGLGLWVHPGAGLLAAGLLLVWDGMRGGGK